MSGEYLAVGYDQEPMPADGPWIIVIGPAEDKSVVGPFRDSSDVIDWYARHGGGQPFHVETLIEPDDYPGAALAAPAEPDDHQEELRLQ